MIGILVLGTAGEEGVARRQPGGVASSPRRSASDRIACANRASILLRPEARSTDQSPSGDKHNFAEYLAIKRRMRERIGTHHIDLAAAGVPFRDAQVSRLGLKCILNKCTLVTGLRANFGPLKPNAVSMWSRGTKNMEPKSRAAAESIPQSTSVALLCT